MRTVTGWFPLQTATETTPSGLRYHRYRRASIWLSRLYVQPVTMAQTAPMAMPSQGMPTGMQPPPLQIPVNPGLQTLLDSLPHNPIPFALQNATIPNINPPRTNTIVTCPAHKASYCEACGVDFNALNYMHQFLRTAPAEAIPPPPNVQPPPQRAEVIKNAKEAGNVRASLLSYRADRFCRPRSRLRISLWRSSTTRNPLTWHCPVRPGNWHRSRGMRRQSPCVTDRQRSRLPVLGRSICLIMLTDRANALADAEAVVALKRPWTKGHFRSVSLL